MSMDAFVRVVEDSDLDTDTKDAVQKATIQILDALRKASSEADYKAYRPITNLCTVCDRKRLDRRDG